MLGTIALATMLAHSAVSQPGDLPAPLLRAFRARPPSFSCLEKEAPPNTFTLTCTPICANPPKTFSVRELTELDVSPKEAPELVQFLNQQYADWHHHCDKHTS